MLLELHVRDFVLIEQASLELGPGLTVVSGATGDGKTLLLRALRFLLGERASPDRTLRLGAPLAVVEGLFRIEDERLQRELRTCGVPDEWEGPDLVLSRSLDGGGKSRIKIGGRLATVTELRAVGTRLVDVLSQHEYQSLSRRDRQRELLDRLAGQQDEASAFESLREALRDDARRRDELAARDADRRAREAERTALLEALRALTPQEGEIDELERERDLLSHLDAVRLSLEKSHERLVEREDAALDLIRSSVRDLSAHAGRSRELDELVRSLEVVGSELAQAGNTLVRERDRLEADPARLSAIEQRLDAYRDLSRRFRATRVDPRELHRVWDELEGEARGAQDPEAALATLDRAIAEKTTQLEKLGGRLRGRRQDAARLLEERVHATLGELAMPDARLQVAISALARSEPAPGATALQRVAARFPSPSGLDEVEVQFAGTPGMPLSALQAVASGGELARVCLALKRALAEADDTPLLVFDEVDQNVGGRLGAAIGRTLTAMSGARQVLAVTHLPSVAAYATRHFTVAKQGGRTTVQLLPAAADRERELALMIRGEPITETALEQARELLALAAEPVTSARPGTPRRSREVRRPRASKATR